MSVKVPDGEILDTIGTCVKSLEVISAIGKNEKEYKELEATLLTFTQKLADRLNG